MMLVFVLALTACSGTGGGGKFSSNEEEKYLNEYYDLAMKPEDPKVVIEKLDKNIARLSQEGASNAIDALIYNVYEKAPTLSEKMNGLQETMTKQAESGIDFNNPESYNKVNDPTLKAFLTEVKDQNMTVIKDVQGFTVVPDMGGLLTKYDSYMSEPLKQIVLFSKSEYEKQFFDINAQKFDLDVVVERILMMENAMKKYPDSHYLSAFAESKSYYYEIYFGNNSDYLIDSKKTVLPEVLEHYKKTVESHKGTQLATDVQSYLDKLKTTNNVVTDDVIVFVDGLTENKVVDKSVEGSDKINDAVNSAIEANGK